MHLFLAAILAIMVHLVTAGTKIPAVHRVWSQLSSASQGLSKRDTCESGNVNGYKCCSDGYYCLSSEECVGFDSVENWCCPAGSYYYEEDCLLPDGTEQEPFPDLGAFQISGLVYYVSTVTLTTTEWFGGDEGYYYTPEFNSITAEVDVFDSVLICQTTDSVAASSYFTSVSSSLSSSMSSEAAYESSSLARQGYKATVITLTSTTSPTASPSSIASSSGGTDAAVSSSHSSSVTKTLSSGNNSTTGTAEHHTTSSETSSKSGTSTAPPSSSATGNAGSLMRAAGSELVAALGLTVIGLTSGFLALLL